MSILKHTPLMLVSVCFALILGLSGISLADDWTPVTPGDLAIKESSIEKDADAEAIFWEVRLDDSSDSELAYKHYIRVKIFNERGRERFSKVDIPFLRGKRVKNVAARIIKADGSIVELKKDDIFEREIVKAGGIKVKAKSFAVPNLEPGVILEYRYSEYFEGDSAGGQRLIFQRDIPIRRISYYVKPYPELALSAEYFNMEEVQFKKDKGGYFVATLENVPSFQEEPRMPPEDQVRSWILLYYSRVNTNSSLLNALVRWAVFSGRISPSFNSAVKPGKEIKAAAQELTAGLTSNDDKLRKLYEFVQREIKNVSFDTAITDAERKKAKNKNANDVLKRKIGDASDVDILFASLAQAAGFDAHLFLSGDRNEYFFNPERNAHESFVHPMGIAIKIDGRWRFFNPGAPYLPYGALVWNEEDTHGITAGNQFSLARTPISGPEKSGAKRNGKFDLLEDGTLKGTVRVELTGHQAISRRRAGYSDSETKRIDDFKTDFTDRMSTAEISDIKIENFEDNSKPLVYTFNISVPNYAQRTGKRIFLQPGFFEYGEKPVFSSATRKFDVHFPYPWSEADEIDINLPAGFSLDNAEAPRGISDPAKIGSLNITIGVSKDQKLLRYDRKFHFGGGGNILFPADSYKNLKGLFDAFHTSDTHTITLKQN